MEGILRPSAVGGGIRQRLDHLQQLDHRSRPAVRHDERQGIRVRRAHMDEMSVDPVDPPPCSRAGRKSWSSSAATKQQFALSWLVTLSAVWATSEPLRLR
jgi:hypothetical protein